MLSPRARRRGRRHWLKDVRREKFAGAGKFTKGTHYKLVWHTTEGSSIDGAIGAYRANGNCCPHITFNPATNEVVQHVPFNRAAAALKHPAGCVETNHAHAIQLELVGFAAKTPDWSKAEYARIARLARKIEKATGVRRQCHVKFAAAGHTHRLEPHSWLHYSGHCGHQHVPGNDHTDPGAFKIDLVV